MRPDNFRSSYVVNDQVFLSGASIELVDGLKAQLAHRSGSNDVAVGLTGGQWEVQHDFRKRDTHFKCKAWLGQSQLTFRQHIPAGNWALLPTPALELRRDGLLGGQSKLVGGYDFLNRVGHLEETVYGGADREHKAQIRLCTAQGAAASLRSKLRAGPLLHSAAAGFSEAGGWQLTAKSRFSDGTKVRTSYSLDRRLVSVQAKHSAKQPDGGGAQATLTLHVDWPLRQKADPLVTLGCKWDL